MKHFNSKKTTGSEAIVMAAVRWWTGSEQLPLKERIEGKLKGLPSDAFTDREIMARTNQNIGMRYLEMDDLIPECLAAIREQDGLGRAFQIALEEWPGKDAAKAQDAARFLILRLLAVWTGALLKGNAEFARFDEDMVTTRANMKVVKRVMES